MRGMNYGDVGREEEEEEYVRDSVLGLVEREHWRIQLNKCVER